MNLCGRMMNEYANIQITAFIIISIPMQKYVVQKIK